MLKSISRSDWNFARAAHLCSRAGFGGTPAEINQLLELGPERAVDSFLAFANKPEPALTFDWAKPDPDRIARFRDYQSAPADKKQELRRMEQRTERGHLQDLRYAWLQRMAEGPHPLQEKLALFWHGHFATSAQKVKSAYYMWRQNDIFHRHGAGQWLTLLTEASKDPAMLVWLDQAQSRKEQPNENFAREVMELFALGEGNYTEKDITEAARAFTGWTLDRQREQFVHRPRMHDSGMKTVLGKTGNFDGDDVLKIIAENPQSDRFISRKLWVFFASENPSDALVGSLASHFQASGQNVAALLRKIFLSEEFYAPGVMRQQVKSPVQWLIGSVRLLERSLPEERICSQAMRMLGQDLLLPPNVKGWDGGLSWINTNNLLNRYNFSNYLVLGEMPTAMPRTKNNGKRGNNKSRRVPRDNAIKVAKLFTEEERSDKQKLAAAIQKRMLHTELKLEHKRTLLEYLDSQGEIDELDILHAIRLVMTTPEYQLT